MTTIADGFDQLKDFLLPGVTNLTNDDLLTALDLTKSLITAANAVELTFDLEDDRRVFITSLMIIQKDLEDLAVPKNPVTRIAPAGTNLFRIALDELGDAQRWTEILNLNSLSDPFINSTLTLTIPEA